jgi:hypothetical protein
VARGVVVGQPQQHRRLWRDVVARTTRACQRGC